jgi:hypothetical protein
MLSFRNQRRTSRQRMTDVVHASNITPSPSPFSHKKQSLPIANDDAHIRTTNDDLAHQWMCHVVQTVMTHVVAVHRPFQVSESPPPLPFFTHEEGATSRHVNQQRLNDEHRRHYVL